MRKPRDKFTFQRGFTLIEIIIVLSIIAILASAAMPLVRISVKKAYELELKRNLRSIREAIDRYKLNYDKHLYKKDEESGRSGYPKTLQELVEKKLLRRVPSDPFTNQADYATRSYTDKPDAVRTDFADVYDVKSASEKTALDNTIYNEW
ncbi:prepilin-type N-terminal cleavage/methylation domain-containing protein [bacterium]|nr:MAG: prepilin-type N-terminal cleavage/methylation domain-containing protein [bacterium]